MASLIQSATAVTQWGIGFANGCGEAALAVVFGILSGQPPTPSDVANLVRQGVQYGTDPSGTSTPHELQQLSAAHGVNLAEGPGGASTLGTINANLAQGFPTIVNVQNARAFGGSDANVFGHYVTVVGRDTNGNYIVDDSNQPAALQGKPVTYTAQQILNAQPYATLTPTSVNNIPIGGGFGGTAFGSTGVPGSNWFQALLSGIGAKSAPDLLWRGGLIVGGMVLIVVGILIFFSHEEETAVNVVSQQAGNAAKAAAVAGA